LGPEGVIPGSRGAATKANDEKKKYEGERKESKKDEGGKER